MGRGLARHWVLIVLMTVATIIGYIDRQLLPISKQSISLELGWTEVHYATVISAGQAAAAVALLLGGFLIDRVSLKWGAPLVVGASALAAAFTGFATTVDQHIIARAALGAALALGVPTFLKIAAAILPSSQLATGIALGTVASSVGAIAAPLLIPQMTLEWGWRASFLVFGGVGCTWVLVWLLATGGTGLGSFAPAPLEERGATLRLFRSGILWGLAGAKTLSDATWWLLLFWLPDLFTRDFGLAETELGIPLALIYALSALGSIAAGLASVRLLRRGVPLHQVRRGTMLFSALCTAILPVALLANEPMMAALLIGLAVAAHQGFSVNLFALITEVAPRHMIGRYTAICIFCGQLGGMAVTMAAGLLLHAQWGYAPLLIAAPLCYMLALAVLRWLVPHTDDTADGCEVRAPALA